MKHTYTHKKNGKKVTLYAAVLYTKLTLNEKYCVKYCTLHPYNRN